MKRVHLLLLLTFSLAAAHASILDSLKYGIEAYQFAYPLVNFEITKDFVGSVNSFSHVSTLPDPNFKIIVRPNVDTLYSFAFLDLTKDPLYMMMPDTNSRYYVLEVMDAWTNVFGSYGKRTTGTQKQEFFITNSSYEGTVPEGLTHIKSPAENAWIAGRIEIYSEEDLPNVAAIQKMMVLKNYAGFNDTASGPRIRGNKTSPDFIVASMSMEEFFNNFTKYLKVNAPSKEDAPMMENLKKIGIEEGKDWDQNNLTFFDRISLRLAYFIGKLNIKYGMKLSIMSKPLVNGWFYRTDTIGNYGTNYKLRAAVAHVGMAANIPEDAVYCNGYEDEDGNTLSGENSYVLHLEKSDIPPVDQFWSLTMYDEDSYLVPNSFNKYAIRDRDALVFNADGSLDLLIQNQAPEQAKLANWLPAPKSKFNLTLRLYGPKQSVFDKTWKPKGLRKLKNPMQLDLH